MSLKTPGNVLVLVLHLAPIASSSSGRCTSQASVGFAVVGLEVGGFDGLVVGFMVVGACVAGARVGPLEGMLVTGGVVVSISSP